jgi:uncharacterized protein YkwD
MIKTFALTCSVVAATLAATPASSLDLNSFRAQHGRPALSVSGMLSGIAYSHAHDLANRRHLDHNGFRQRLNFTGGTAAENVLVGCADEDCAFRKWAATGGHRANMLRGDVTSYGLASATDEKGRRYWVLELGN